MYEVYDAQTGELKRVDLFELEHGLASGLLVSEFEEKAKRGSKPQAAADENQS